uniref:FIP-RBD domain-containing protein n=1 Tax=Eptatretus burgeri TaxID=7764 RepID=A0A8C4PX02_EPTBU
MLLPIQMEESALLISLVIGDVFDHVTQNRMKLMADTYEDIRENPNSCSAKGSQQPSPDQAKRELLEVHHNRARLRLYVAHLTNLCQEHGPDILHNCPGITSGDIGSTGVDDERNRENEEEEDLEWENHVRNLSPAQVAEELAREERAAEEMQTHADALLQCISDQRPDLLELVHQVKRGGDLVFEKAQSRVNLLLGCPTSTGQVGREGRGVWIYKMKLIMHKPI